MLDIKVYGTGTSGHQMVVSTLKQYLNQANIQYSLKEICDVNTFLDQKIQSVPAIRINSQPVYYINHNGGFNLSLKRAIVEILKIYNFGDLRKVIVPFNFRDASVNAYYYCKRFLTGSLSVMNVEIDYKDTGDKGKNEALYSDFFEERFNDDWIDSGFDSPIINIDSSISSNLEMSLDSIRKKGCLVVLGIDSLHENTTVDRYLNRNSSDHLLLVPKAARFKKIEKISYISQSGENVDLDFLVEFNLSTATYIKVYSLNGVSIELSQLRSTNERLNIEVVDPDQEIKSVLDIGQYLSNITTDLIVLNRSDFLALRTASNNKSILTLTRDIPLLII